MYLSASMTMFNVIIADDHTIVLEGLVKIINQSGEFKVTGKAVTGRELLSLLDKSKCDIALIDVVMPDLDGLQILKIIQEKHPDTKTVMLTMYSEKKFFDSAVKTGADGYVLKDDSPETLLTVLRSVMKGYKTFSPKIQTLLVKKYTEEPSPMDILTVREMEVFKYIAQGLYHREIADKLNISMSTVEFHKKNIKEKLGAKNIAGMLNIAHKYNII